MKQPNIVFIFSDQQRWDTLGCYGQTLPVTPHLDKMAGEGVRFAHAFTPNPVCGPARACLQTGMYATETGCFRNDIALPAGTQTLAGYLGAAGYITGYVGKWHLASGREEGMNFRKSPVPPGRRGGYQDYWMAADLLEHTSHGVGGYVFDRDNEKKEFPGLRAEALTDMALVFIRQPRTAPFFLFLSLLEPHHQNDTGRFEAPEGTRKQFEDFEVPGDLRGAEGDWRDHFPDYLACCALVDAQAGRILAALEAQGILEDTLVVFTSDHGNHFRTRNSEYKRSCHEASIRIPLLIRGPGFRGGQTTEGLTMLTDLMPTLLRAAGTAVPGHLRGKPLQDLVSGAGDCWREDIFVQVSESEVGRAVRTKKWKYGVSAAGVDGWKCSGAKVYTETSMYDLENDPCERRNLAGDPGLAEVAELLRARLIQHMGEAGEYLPDIIR